jgi:uncharacterized DUF497 family protein
MTETSAIVIRDGGSSVDITEIEIDDGNEEHLTRHGVSIAEVQQVLAGHPDIRRNRKDRAGTHVALGQTNGGRRVVVPLIDKGNGRIRPISAWEVGT